MATEKSQLSSILTLSQGIDVCFTISTETGFLSKKKNLKRLKGKLKKKKKNNREKLKNRLSNKEKMKR